jgi:hypothetical protein
LKPERWGSPLVQEKDQEERACDKRHPHNDDDDDDDDDDDNNNNNHTCSKTKPVAGAAGPYVSLFKS